MTWKPCIYSITCPITDKIRYIGRSNYPFMRFKMHLSAIKADATKSKPLYIWMNKIIDLGKEPIFKIEMQCETRDLSKMESFYIKKYATETELFNSIQKIDRAEGIDIQELKAIAKAKNIKYKDIAKAIGAKPCAVGGFFRQIDYSLSLKKAQHLQQLIYSL